MEEQLLKESIEVLKNQKRPEKLTVLSMVNMNR